MSVAQTAIAWVLAQGPRHGVDIVPLVGARRRDRLAEALGAMNVTLSAEDLNAVEAAVRPDPRPARGTRRRKWPTSTVSTELAVRSYPCHPLPPSP